MLTVVRVPKVHSYVAKVYSYAAKVHSYDTNVHCLETVVRLGYSFRFYLYFCHAC